MPATAPSAAASNQEPRRALSLFDSTSIIVGIIIGSAIYESSPLVAAGAMDWTFDSPLGRSSYDWLRVLLVCGIWIAGGVVALLGAMCYAELGTAHPHAGGTYVYLSQSLGKSVGFAFAWAEFWIVRPGNVGAVAFVLARYAAELLPAGSQRIPHLDLHLAGGAILILAVLNAMGLRAGTWTQNALTACKVLGLLAIIATALSVAPPAGPRMWPARGPGSLPLAMILVMFAYGGWADMSFVAAEVRHPERNIFRALLLGTLAVTLIYVAVNMAFIFALGLEGLAGAKAVAADVLARRFGSGGSRVISLLVVISCLGAINGMLFTGARVYYALGTHHPTFRWLGTWNERSGVPLRSLAVQTLVTVGLVVGFGLSEGGFARLVVFTGPFYWGFIALVGVALVILRLPDKTETSLYRVPLFPVTPILFALTSGAMAYAAIDYAYRHPTAQAAWWAVIVVVTGLVVGVIDWFSRR